MSKLLLRLIMLAVLITGFDFSAPAAHAAGDCSAVLYGNCLQVSYYSQQLAWGTGVLPMDNRFNYWGSMPGDRSDHWSFPSACTNQAQIDASANAGNVILPACAVDPSYVNTFLKTISDYIYNPNYTCVEPNGPTDSPYPSCAADRRDAIGAATIINTMMNQQSSSFTGATIRDHYISGVERAKALFGPWSTLVRQYDAAGLISWNFQTFEPLNHINSTSVLLSQDVVFFRNPNSYPVGEIKFTSPGGGTLYEINRRCGNIAGAVNPFPDFSTTAVLQNGPGTPVGGSTAAPGGPLHTSTPYVLNAGAWNAGPGAAAPQTLTLTVPAGITPTAPYAGGIWNPANRTITWTGVVISGTGSGNAAFKGLGFSVDSTVPNGTTVTFQLVTGPANNTGVNAPPVTLSYLVNDPRLPSVVGSNGDVHAGGGLCGQAGQSGSIKSYPGAGSGTQYVFSATGTSGDFDSAGGSSLNLGQGYSQICRPDLIAATDTYFAAGKPVSFICGQTDENNQNCHDFDITGKSGVFIYNGFSPLTLHGTVNNKLTVVARNVGVTITDRIMLDNNLHPSRATPSLGVIAAGDIAIPASVTRVDAYLFSNAAIDTCLEGNNSCSTPTLTVNGFLMAKTIRFNRLGPLATRGPQLAEHIVLTPQIYLNPPTLFDNQGLTQLDGQGERQPLF